VVVAEDEMNPSAYMVEGKVHEENSEFEDDPEVLHENVLEKQEGQCIEIDEKAEEALRSHHQLGSGDGADESRLALIDTACTSCMHSKKWREAYSQTLPKGFCCEKTPKTKIFHFADGSSTSSRVEVWKIPIFLGGHPGYVQSAEVTTGTTPLLFSISALEALDAVLFLRKKVMEVRVLSLELDMVKTSTKHLAVEIASGDKKLGQPRRLEEARFQSRNEDLYVYLGQEAAYSIMFSEPRGAEPGEVQFCCKAQFGPRGVRKDDERGEISERRLRELAKSVKRLRLADQRTWVALKREYSLAEQFATRGFSTTVIFEPFGGSFGVTRTASQEWGWTNSQPMDLLDGYDLLSPGGRLLVKNTLSQHKPFMVVIAFDCRIWSLLTNMNPSVDWERMRRSFGFSTLKLVEDICEHQHCGGRFYLVENPAGSKAWNYRDVLPRILERLGGKFVFGDQCPFGKKDKDSGRPEQKRTGWLSNSEVVLNEVGRRCSCPRGTHQQIIGHNTRGLRSKQAAEYPKALCRAICRGVLKQMELVYVSEALQNGHAFPVGEEEDEDMTEQQAEVAPPLPEGDVWEVIKEPPQLIRHHVLPRRALFVPAEATEPPVPFARIKNRRVTYVKNLGEEREVSFEDEWMTEREEAARELDRPWTGRTAFDLEEESEEVVEELAAAPSTLIPQRTLQRKRARTKQLQRGLWSRNQEEEVKSLMQGSQQAYAESGMPSGWSILDLRSELGVEWKKLESASAEVTLILMSPDARRLKKPQPHAQPAAMPLRKTYLLMDNDDVLTSGWEEYSQMAPASQIRALPRQPKKLSVTLFGVPVGEVTDGGEEEGQVDPRKHKEEERERKWQVLPRELKLALQRIHINLGHARLPDMLRALRISKASEVALRACRLFRCKECPRLLEPKIPRPSRLPQIDEFNVSIGLDVFSEKDADGGEWVWLNVVDEGTGFQVCTLLGDTHRNPTGSEVIQAFEMSWLGWAGMPEKGVIVDRAKYFLGELATRMADEGCTFDAASKASPWQIGFVERAGGLWKTSFRRLVWAAQVAGKDDVVIATGAINSARNNLARRSGFSPSQWVLGRNIRLPADLADEGEVARIGAQSAAETPSTKFFRRNQLRMAAREAFVRAANDSALRKAELSRIRPTRGPFKVGDYVFYYDQSDNAAGPHHWRGVARVVGHEGSRTVWVSHRGILIAASPEHLSHANEEEIRGWMVTSNETTLMDAMPAAGGTGFLDIRSRPIPPEAGFPEEETLPEEQRFEEKKDEEREKQQEAQKEEEQRAEASDLGSLSASSTSMARIELESEREKKRSVKSYNFFEAQRQKRLKKASAMEKIPDLPFAEALETPVGPDYDPDLHDYHQHQPTEGPPPIPEAVDSSEAAEREAKRQRVSSEAPAESALFTWEKSFSYLVVSEEVFLESQAKKKFEEKEIAYLAEGVSEETFLFGVERNDFEERYQILAEEIAMQAGEEQAAAVKKKARKEVVLKDLDRETRAKFEGAGGSDEKEWKAWLDKDACEVMSTAESQKVLQEKPECVIPTRWVRTNKSEGKPDEPYFPKSRLVVQGFKDKALGQYRRDAPTGSALAEALVLALSAAFGFQMVCKDIKNAYFSGKEIGRELYLLPPRGGLPGVGAGQILKAKKAIYGFAEAARLFWLALRDHLMSDGWVESRLEPALFYLRGSEDKRLRGILVTHVDDIQAGVGAEFMEEAFQKSSTALEFATNNYHSYTFRGREIRQVPGGHIDVTMSNYARSMKPIKIDKVRKNHLEARLNTSEKETLQSGAGELGWITRQLRCDLAFETGCIQRSKVDPCVADLVRLRLAISAARRAADFRQRFWSDVDPYKAVIVHLADSGHANGTPENDNIMKYRSVGGYFLLLANPGVLEGEEVRANMMSFQSSQTKRVCRSTLAAEAAHLAEAIESGDWLAVVLEEALYGDIDLKNWDRIVERRERVYVTDAQSVYDYLSKETASQSSDKRMAIEGALLRETTRKRGSHVRWIDGGQNMADVLTKAKAEREAMFSYLRSGLICLTQTEANRRLKEKKQLQRQSRKKEVREDPRKQKMRQERIDKLAKEMQDMKSESSDARSTKENKGV